MIIILLEQCIHEFWLVHLLFSSCALFHSLFLSRAPEAVWEKNVIVAIGWGECSLGATSIFDPHSKRKMQIFHATFWMCVYVHHHFCVELSSFHCISHTQTHRLQYFLFIFLFFRRLLLRFNDSLFFLSSDFLVVCFFLPFWHFSSSAIVSHYTFDIIKKIVVFSVSSVLFCSYVNL